MLLQVNQNELEERIEREVEGAIQKISSNAYTLNGISVTEITFENDIFFKCRIKFLNE
jgi:hypothetical protein